MNRKEGIAEPKITAHLPSGKEEIIPHTYYSTRRLEKTPTTYANREVIFFNYTIGQTADGIVATEVDTNIKKPNAVEQPNRFWLKKIDMLVLPNVEITDSSYITDILNLVNNTKFVLKISVKERLVIAPTTDLLASSQILPPNYNVFKKTYTLKNEELLPPEINFVPSLIFNSDATAFTNNVKVVVRLHGRLVRLADL